MDIHISRVAVTYPTSVFVQWDFNPDNGVTGSFLFTLERSGSPEGPWRKLAGPLTNAVSYTEDYTKLGDTLPFDSSVSDQANLLSLQREIYYRVSVIAPNGVEAVSTVVDLDGIPVHSPTAPRAGMGETVPAAGKYFSGRQPVQNPPNGPGRPHRRLVLLRRKILRDQYILMKHLSGLRAQVFKRRHFGVRCPDCSDTLTRAITQYNCTTCFGTGWTGGFYTPIDTFFTIRSTPPSSEVTSNGVSEASMGNITMLGYPLVMSGDLLVEVDTDRRWSVMSSAPTELHHMVVHQRVSATELSRDSVEYDV